MPETTSPRVPGSSGRRELLWVLPVTVLLAGTLGANRNATQAAFLVAGVLGLAACGAVLLALRSPRAAVLVNGLALGAYYLDGLADGPVFVTIPMVAFVAAQRRAPRSLLPFLGPGLAVTAAGLIWRGAAGDVPGWQTFWQVVGAWAAAMAAGSLGWWARVRREMGLEQAHRAATEEQLRMAQDLHDGVGHGLAMIAMQAGVALHVLDRDPVGVRESLEAIRTTSREALDALRLELARVGSAETAVRRPGRGLADLDALADRVRSGGLEVELAVAPELLGQTGAGRPELGTEVEAVAYAVVQESLTNVLRHADARRSRIVLDLSGSRLSISVTDDGVGDAGTRAADFGQTQDNDGMGLPGMRARVNRLGGSLQAGPGPDGGWRVHAVLPVEVGPR